MTTSAITTKRDLVRTALAAGGRSAATVLLLLLFSVAGVAQAAWLADGSGDAYSAAHWMPAGHAPGATVNDSSVTVSWSPSVLSSSIVSTYVVRRYTNGQPAVVNAAVTCTATCSTRDTPGTGTWQYTVTPVHDQWSGAESSLSPAVMVAPPAPTGLSATAESSSAVRLSWTKATDNTATEPGTSEGQWVYGRPHGGSWALLATVGLGVEGYVDAGLPCGTIREYYVVTYDAHGQTPSNEASATTHACAPAAPTDLAAAIVSTSQVNLTWSHAGATHYRVERSPDGTTWAEVGTSPTTSFADTTLSCGQTRHYRVFAHDAATGLTSVASNTVAASTSACVAPAAPTGLTAAVVSASQVNLTWSHAGATQYRIERTSNGTIWTQIGTSTASSYSDTTLSCGQTRAYRVLAHDEATGLTSSTSNFAIATTPSCPLVLTLRGHADPLNGSNWEAAVTVTATRGGQPASGVAVAGNFSTQNANQAPPACTTGADGICSFKSRSISNSDSTTFTVSTVNGAIPTAPLSITILRP